MRKYQPYSKRRGLETEVNYRSEVLSGNAPSGSGPSAAVAAVAIQDKGKLRHLQTRDEQRLKAMTPPSLQQLKEERNVAKEAVIKRTEQLEKAIISGDKVHPGMLTEREMQENPAGSGQRHLAWEKFIKNHQITPDGQVIKLGPGQRSMCEEWKDLRSILYKDMEHEGPDISNVEVLRSRAKAYTGAADYGRISYAPLAALSDEEYVEMFGAQNLSEVALRNLHISRLEKEVQKGEEDYWSKMVKTS